MNPHLSRLKPYPFEQLNALLADITPASQHDFITLSLGEPKHPAPDFIVEQYMQRSSIIRGFGTYPPTRGIGELRAAIADFVNRRFKLSASPIDPESQALPVTGTREALFAFAQTVIDSSADSYTLMPNPFYQIYEGAAVLAGSQPVYIPCTKETDYLPDFTQVTAEQWDKCALLYLCTPGNPTGAVASIALMQSLIRLSDEHNFVIASDECYSEIYADEQNPPPGLLEAACAMGRHDYKNCIAFNSLSKRSNLPGLRSGYACGDADIISAFLLYRTYHGSAMSVHSQWASVAAWQDEQHVITNREIYRQKYTAVHEILHDVWPMSQPTASFYLWPETPVSDEQFTQRLLEKANIKVLPGSYLSRVAGGINPGQNRVRLALVATIDECVVAAERLRGFMQRKEYL
jgi:N-succinyldiaminopimelate aminotransferase